jgi:hypothetical protein
MLPDPGCYEARRHRGREALRLAAVLPAVGLGLLWHTSLISVVISAALAVLLAIPAVLTLALPLVAFRADHAGITLGSDRLLPRRPAVFIPWTDVEKIIFYSAYTDRGGQTEFIGVQRRDGAPALPYGNEQAPGCPVSGVVAGATRRVIRWWLDRERLAAVTAAVAPGIPMIDAGNDPGRRIEGPGQRQDRQPGAV